MLIDTGWPIPWWEVIVGYIKVVMSCNWETLLKGFCGLSLPTLDRDYSS